MSAVQYIDPESQHECPVCMAEAYVLYEHEKMCANCGHTPSPEGSSGLVTTPREEWKDWHQHRREEYEGWYGEDRIRFPGGFVGAYDI